MDKKSLLANLRELFQELNKSESSKEDSIFYIYSLIGDILSKPEREQNEIILWKLDRARNKDFRYSSNYLGRWAESIERERDNMNKQHTNE